MGDVRIQATNDDAATPVFVGIARDEQGAAYLADVELRFVGAESGADRPVSGGAPPVPPGDLGAWDAAVSGQGTRQLDWTSREGRWSTVLMNADGSRGLATEVSVGFTVPWLGSLGAVMTGLALVPLAAAAVLIAVPVRRMSRRRG